jgi:hypothetical protein
MMGFPFPLIIVKFPFIAATSQQHLHMEIEICQLIRYSWACGVCHDFLDRELLLKRKLMNQCILLVKLKSSLWKFTAPPWLGSPILNIYVPFAVITIRCFPRSWLIIRFITRLTLRIPLVEQELLILPEHPEFTPDF